jgi:long-chain fatty acid transport protein
MARDPIRVFQARGHAHHPHRRDAEMSRLSRMLLIAGASVGLTAAAALGAGFQIPEQGMGPLGMGMGSVGLAEDLSAIYHNPAGLTQLEGMNAAVSLVAIKPSATYTRRDTLGATIGAKCEAKDDPIPIPALAISKSLRDDLTVALGVYTPYGLSSEYSETGAQRYMTTNIALTTFYVGPYVAWRPLPKLSVGAGVQYVYGAAELGQHANYGGALLRKAAALAAAGNTTLRDNLATFEGGDPRKANEDVRLDGVIDITDATANTMSLNVGVLYQITEQVQVGATFRKGVDLNVEGDVKLTVPDAVKQFSGGTMQSLTTTGSTTVSLPDVFGLGVAYRPRPELVVTSEFDYHRWSCYKNLDFDFAVNDADATFFFQDAKNPRNWDDTFTFRLGSQYQIGDQHKVRAGYLFDQEPIVDNTHGPELPMNDRNGLCLGYGFTYGRYTVDVAYSHLFIKDRTVDQTIRGYDAATKVYTNPSVLPLGDYESAANIAGISLSVSL